MLSTEFSAEGEASVFDHMEAAEGATHVLRVVPGTASAALLPIERVERTGRSGGAGVARV